MCVLCFRQSNFIPQLSQAFPDEGVEKYIPQSVELDPRSVLSPQCCCLCSVLFYVARLGVQLLIMLSDG